MATAATTALAVGARARKDVASHFMTANAVSPDSAISFETSRPVHRRTFRRMIAAGVLVEATAGRWYMNVPAYAADNHGRRKHAGLLVAGAAVLAAIAAATA